MLVNAEKIIKLLVKSTKIKEITSAVKTFLAFTVRHYLLCMFRHTFCVFRRGRKLSVTLQSQMKAE